MPKSEFSLLVALNNWWRRRSQQAGPIATFLQLNAIFWDFLRDSLPDRRRQRYGDIDYDWEERVDTTSATVSWRVRLMGLLNSPYQPIPVDEFRAVMRELRTNLSQFTFVDVGSGKGRALLLAAGYGFKRIIGIELLPELHRIAQQNVSNLKDRGLGQNIQLIRGDATGFTLPDGPAVIFLFNPLPKEALSIFLENVACAWRRQARPLYIAYVNPIHQNLLATCGWLTKVAGCEQFSIFVAGVIQ